MAQKLVLPRRGFAYPDDSAAVAYLTRGTVEAPFMEALIRSYEFDRYHGPGRFTGASWRISVRSGVNVARSRCKAVREFLATGAEWLWMVDDDMAWAPDALELMLRTVDRTVTARPNLEPHQVVVGGLCFAYLPQGEGTGPTLYDRLSDGRFQQRTELPAKGKTVQVAGTGAAFLLVHRELLKQIEAGLGGVTQCPWFREHEQLIPTEWDDAGEPTAAMAYWVSEDLWFCDQVARAGGVIMVDTGVEVAHKKPHMLTRQFYEAGTLTVA